MDKRMPANGSPHSGDSAAPSSDAADAVNGNKRSTRPCHKRRMFTDALMREHRRWRLRPERATACPGREFRRAADVVMMLSSLACASIKDSIITSAPARIPLTERLTRSSAGPQERLRGLLFFHGFGDIEHLAEVGKISLVVTHVLAGGIGEFGHGLAIAANHLDHDLQRLVTQVVGQVGAHAESELTAAVETFV